MGAGGYLFFASRRARQRAERFAEPLQLEWLAMLDHVPLYKRMPSDVQRKLAPLVRQFLSDIQFVGCDGLEITDEMRLTIASQACALVVSHGFETLGDLRSVLVYPDQFVVDEVDIDEAGVVTEGRSDASGQSIDTDKIVLSWRDVQEAGKTGDGYNVVLHEFAHYLDNIVGGTLTDRSTLNEVLEREYDALCDAVDRGDETLIDPYGSEDPVEFFAVATETFFELPTELMSQHPALYALLRNFYSLDPAKWE